MKHLVICCDGTWCKETEEDKLTNIVRLHRVITPQNEEGISQLAFYDAGIGTEGGIVDAITGGLYGEGMDKNVLDAYKFLIEHYEPEDKLYFFGFSRGAYTVRSLVGLLNNAGLIKKEHVKEDDHSILTSAYEMYRSKDPLDSPHGSNAEAFRLRYAHEVDIEFLGVFDTVGALGIPIGLMTQFNMDKYGFHDTTLSRIVKNAYHAVAIDELRYGFFPTLWRAKPGTTSEQRWFPGSHGDVGGGPLERGLSDRTLQWMLTKAHECGMDYDLFKGYPECSPDASDVMHDSYTSIFSLLGKHRRHVCDTAILNQHSIAIPHEFHSSHSWFKESLDKLAPREPIPWWSLLARIRSWFDTRSMCDMNDMKVDSSVWERKFKLGYAPSNIMPLVFQSLIKEDAQPEIPEVLSTVSRV